MARAVKDAKLDTSAARKRLDARPKPYYRQLEQGLHLGYRKSVKGSGRWVARYYLGGDEYETETFNVADDNSDADGVLILSYWQAQTVARQRLVERARKNAGVVDTPQTVAEAVELYLQFLETNKKSGREARYAANAVILPALGKVRLDALGAEQIRRWHNALAKSGARVRTRKGDTQKFKDGEFDPERIRKRKSTANRHLTTLKAALNRAWREGYVASDAAWRRVEPFENVEAARQRYLTIAEAQRLVNASDPDFRSLVQGALETGARYGELCALTVADFNIDSGTIAVSQSKSGKGRHIVISPDGISFFDRLTAGRGGIEPMFMKADGSQWLADHQSDPIAKANQNAQITPPINFHGLRHTWASHAVMAGMPLLLVAKNLGHSTTRMVEKHYGHLAQTFVTDTIRATAPRFGMTKVENVKKLRP